MSEQDNIIPTESSRETQAETTDPATVIFLGRPFNPDWLRQEILDYCQNNLGLDESLATRFADISKRSFINSSREQADQKTYSNYRIDNLQIK